MERGAASAAPLGFFNAPLFELTPNMTPYLAAVILSPEEYARLSEIEEDDYLLIEATRRLADSYDYIWRMTARDASIPGGATFTSRGA